MFTVPAHHKLYTTHCNIMNSLDILSYYIWYVNFSVAGYVSGVDLGRGSLTTASGLLISHLHGNSRFLPFIDLEKFYGQLKMEGFSGNPRNPLKTAPVCRLLVPSHICTE